jgi:hypothetical protein
VLCVDEKSQVQAHDRTALILSLRAGIPEKQAHDYVRHGTTSSSPLWRWPRAGSPDACYPRHRHDEFLVFLKQVAKAYPRVKVLDAGEGASPDGLAGDNPKDDLDHVQP